MRKNQIKLMAAGMLVLALMTGCGSGDNNADEGLNNIIPIDMEDAEQNVEEQESQANIEDKQESQTNMKEEQESQANTKDEQTEANGQPQSAETSDDIEKELAAYRSEREQGTSSLGNYTMVQLPNEENYNYDVGDGSSYTSRFDSRELNEAFKVAGAYIKDTLNLDGDVWACIDPRMTAIYEDEDKGVADGYDADNIFLCEYNDNGNWQYLILVREKKGSDWKVLHHGSSYKME